MDREEVEVNKNANTDQGQSSAIMNEQAWSVKYSTLSPERQLFLAGPTREIPGGQDAPNLPTQVANHNEGFTLSCPLMDSATQKHQFIPLLVSSTGTVENV